MPESPLKKLEQRLTAMPGVSIVCPACNTVIDHWCSGTLYDQLNVHTSHGCEDHCYQCDNWFPVLPNVKCDQSVKNIMQEIMRENELHVINVQQNTIKALTPAQNRLYHWLKEQKSNTDDGWVCGDYPAQSRVMMALVEKGLVYVHRVGLSKEYKAKE